MDAHAPTANNPGIQVGFRLSQGMYAELLTECGRCSCNVSGFIRHAVVKEIAARQKARRLEEKRLAQLPGQSSIEDGTNA